MDAFDFNRGMGQLRSLLGERFPKRRIEELLSLIEHARAGDSMRYDDQWLPYLQSFATKLPRPLQVKGTPERCMAIAECLPFASLHLVLPESLVDDDLARMSQEPVSRAITALTIESDLVSSQGLLYLADADWYPQLQFLRLASDRFGMAGYEAFLSQIPADALDGLELATRHLKGSILERLFACPPLGHVKHLSLSGSALGESFEKLLELLEPLSLRSLGLPRCNLDEVNFSALLATSLAPRLERLNLSCNSFDLRTARQLQHEDGVFANLQSLDLSHNKLGDEGLKLLLDTEAISSTCELDLCFNGITFAGLDALAAHPRREHIDVQEDSQAAMVYLFTRFGWIDPKQPLVQLGDLGALVPEKATLADTFDCLDLRSARLTDLECAVLADLPALEHVRYLDLSYNDISDAGLAILADSPYLSNVQQVDVRENPITAWGILYLTRSVNWSSLQEIEYIPFDREHGFFSNESIAVCRRLLDPASVVVLSFDIYNREEPIWELLIDGVVQEFGVLFDELADSPLEQPSRFPASLALDEFSLVGYDGEQCLYSLARAPKPLTHIRTLRVNNCELGTLNAIHHMFRDGFAFERLDFWRAGIGDYHWYNELDERPLNFAHLATLEPTSRLTSINLAGNYRLQFDYNEAAALMLPAFDNLRELVLPDGAIIMNSVLQALEHNRPELNVIKR